MKIKIVGFLQLLIVLTFQQVSAQRATTRPSGFKIEVQRSRIINYFPDSMRVEFPEQKALVIFELRNVFKDPAIITHFTDSLKVWIGMIEKAGNLSSVKKINITTRKNGVTEITLKESDEKITRLSASGKNVTELLPPGWEVFVQQENYKVYIYAQTFDGLSQLTKQDFNQAIEKVNADNKLQSFGRMSLNSRFVVKEGQLAFSDVRRNFLGDQILLRAGGGVGLLGDKLYPELNLLLTLRFTDRFNRPAWNLTLNYNNKFLMERNTEGSYSMYRNAFLDLSWNVNLKTTGQPSWIGLGAGYLLKGSGDYFKGNTMKLFISKDLTTGLTVVPELFLTDDFKKGIMGVRLNYTF